MAHQVTLQLLTLVQDATLKSFWRKKCASPVLTGLWYRRDLPFILERGRNKARVFVSVI